MIIKLGVLFYYNIICKTNRRAWVAQWVGLPSNSYKPITNMTWVSYKKGCTRLAAASDKVYQLLAHGRWFSPGTLASSTTKTGCHGMAWYSWNIAESGIKHQKSINQASKTNMTIISCELWKCNLFSSWHTVNRHKYSSPSILCYIFYIKPHFSKKLLWSHF